MTMKAISIQQPWAWLIVNGHKDIENRKWSTRFRGEVYIHTGIKFDGKGYDAVREAFPHIQMPEPKDFQRGGVVGKATITHCVAQHPSPWFVGEYGFVIRHALPLPFVPCKGQLGFFDVTDAMKGRAV